MTVIAIILFGILFGTCAEQRESGNIEDTTPVSEVVPELPGKSVTDRYDDYFRKYTKRFFGFTLVWRWFKAQAMAESNLNPEAVSWVGARGILQIMPSTWGDIISENPDFENIDSPRWNIAGGIFYDKRMWNIWEAPRPTEDRIKFMFGSYNAGAGYPLSAQGLAIGKGLNPNLWESVIQVAPDVPRWIHEETLAYVERIFRFKSKL